jgi:arsenite methyltransferase
MSGGLQFDEEISRKIEAVYLTPDVVAQRGRVLKALELRQDERVLDIGSGPGLLAYDMAAAVGRDGHVCGIDISEDMLTMSRKRCADLPWAEFQRADATSLPYPDGSFDAAVSTQSLRIRCGYPGSTRRALSGIAPGRSRGHSGHGLWVASDSHGGRGSHGTGVICLERTFCTCQAAPYVVSATSRRRFYDPAT